MTGFTIPLGASHALSVREGESGWQFASLQTDARSCSHRVATWRAHSWLARHTSKSKRPTVKYIGEGNGGN